MLDFLQVFPEAFGDEEMDPVDVVATLRSAGLMGNFGA